MSRLCDKYCIPVESLWRLYKDGVISCSWSGRDEIWEMYQKLKGSKSQSEIIFEISQAKGVSESTVKQAIQKLR